MTGWAPNTARVIDNGYGGSRGGAAITGIVIHHAAGTDSLGYVAGYNPRNSHPTYHIAKDGTVTGIVHPDRRPYSTANGVDAFAVTVEMDNTFAGGDWPVSEAELEALRQIITHHAAQSPRAGHPVEVNNPAATQAGFWVGWHRQYVNTYCPGEFVLARIGALVGAVNAGKPTTPVPPKPTTPVPPGSLVVDGILGPLTTRKMQAATGAVVDGIWGRETTTKLQRKLGVTADGIVGPITRKALQRHLGVTQDGVWGPITIRALQTRLNAGTF